MAQLIVNMMGSIEILLGDTRLNKILSNKAIGLIGLLFLDLGKKTKRDNLIAYMWADSDEESARYNLRYNLWNIRKVIPADQNGQKFILADRDYCQINTKFDFESDLVQILQAEKDRDINTMDQLNEYKNLFRGDFFEGFYLKGCDDFNDRIQSERIRFQNMNMDLLKLMAERYAEQQNYKDCVSILNELTSIEPFDEEIALKQMKAFLDWGKKGKAIIAYRKFETSLRSNLKVSPGGELKNLYRQLLDESERYVESQFVTNRIQKKEVKIEVSCMLNTDYFCVSEIIREIIGRVDCRYVYGFSKCYLEDLNYIQLEICMGYEKLHPDKCVVHTVLPTVRVADAFFEFIKYICEVCILEIWINNPEEMDGISAKILDFTKRLSIEGLTISESEK